MSWCGFFYLHSINGTSLILLEGEKKKIEKVVKRRSDGNAGLRFPKLSKYQAASLLTRMGLSVALVSRVRASTSFAIARELEECGVELGKLYPTDELEEILRSKWACGLQPSNLTRWSPRRPKREVEALVKRLRMEKLPKPLIQKSVHGLSNWYIFRRRVIVEVEESEWSTVLISVRRFTDAMAALNELNEEEMKLLKRYGSHIAEAFREIAQLQRIPREEADAVERLVALTHIVSV